MKLIRSLILIFLCITYCVAGTIADEQSTVTISILPGNLERSPGDTLQVQVFLDSAPEGLSGYNVTLLMTNPGVAEILDVEYPSWAQMPKNGTLPGGSVWCSAVDLTGASGNVDITLFNATISVNSIGITNITIIPTRVEDRSAGRYYPEIIDAILQVNSLIPPTSITNLHNTTYQQTSITWTWTDPISADFDHVMVFLDGVFQENATQGVESFTATGLNPATAYTIGTRTVGNTGLVNETWVNNTATTAPEPVIPVPPGSITNLHNTTYQQTSITWTWTDPISADFDHVMVFIDGVFQGNVTAGEETFLASSLTPETSYTIGTCTVGTTGLVNETWVNNTATTAPEPVIPVPPGSITNLHNTTYQQTSITWTWTDPISADFDHVMVFLDGVFQGNVTQDIQSFTATGLNPATEYTIGTRTVGNTGLVNETWVNNTATTAPEPVIPVPPTSITNLHNTTYQQTSITWTWTDPISADFAHVMVYLDGIFQGNVTEGTETYLATSLTPATSYTIGTRTVGTPGLVNSTWVNHTAMTAPDNSGPIFDLLLNEGWNIFSTPIVLESGNSKFTEIFPVSEQEKLLIVLGWDGSNWFIPTAETVVQPLDAYFIKIAEEETAHATIIPSNSVSSLPASQVTTGINLIGFAPAYDSETQSFPEMPLNQALVSIEYVGSYTGYTIVVSPSYNQPAWSYAKGGQIHDFIPFKGYWVVMENGPDTLYGFSTTPI